MQMYFSPAFGKYYDDTEGGISSEEQHLMQYKITTLISLKLTNYLSKEIY